MPLLQFRLLGGCEIRWDSGPRIKISIRKAQALLAYLAVQSGKTTSRETLANLLWSDRGDKQAYGSLRQTLTVLRKALEPVEPSPLIVEKDDIYLDLSAIDVDAFAFTQLHTNGNDLELETAAALYRGDLLEGFTLPDPVFDEWLEGARREYRQAGIRVLAQLLKLKTTKEAHEDAILCAQRLLNLDPLQESIHRDLMDLYVRVGQRNSALHQFELCRDLLERDLGVPPEAETEALADRIRQDRLENKSTPKAMETVLEDTKSPRYPDDPPDETPNETIVEGPPTDTLSRRPNQTNSSNGGAERAERRLAAIVSADVAGFSRLMNVDEAGTLASLRAHRAELIDPLIAEHGGRIVKTMGDGLLLEFPSVLAAVHCCVEVQDGMEVRNAGVVGDEAIRFRIGVHLGDIVVEGGDIFGNGVNIAANLQEMAETGSVWKSEVSHEQIRSNLDLYYEDQGHRQLKNISETVHAYRVHTGSQAREGDGLIARKSSGNRFRMISGSIAVGLIAVAVFGWLVFDLGGFGQNSSVCKDHLGLPVPCPIRDH